MTLRLLLNWLMSDLANIDTNGVDKILSSLGNADEVKSIINKGISVMAEIYYQSVLQTLRSKMGSSADSNGTKYRYPLSSGIGRTSDEVNMVYGIHALKDFRLRFFEGGTKPRYTKGHKITGRTSKGRLKRTGKGGYRGFITANHFFTEGITNAERQAEQSLYDSVTTSIRNLGITIEWRTSA